MNTPPTPLDEAIAQLKQYLLSTGIHPAYFSEVLTAAQERQALAQEKQRLFDLVRWARCELHEAGLINDQEYAELACAPDSKECVARLETYDQMRDVNKTLLAQVEQLKEDGELINCLRNLMGHARQGEGEIVQLFEDDATFTIHITVGTNGKEHYWGNNLREAIRAAMKQGNKK